MSHCRAVQRGREHNLNQLDPEVLEYKFYARGIGLVLAVGVSGGDDREELVRYARGRSR